MVVMRQLSGEENRPRVGGKEGGRREREEGERDRDTERETHVNTHTAAGMGGSLKWHQLLTVSAPNSTDFSNQPFA